MTKPADYVDAMLDFRGVRKHGAVEGISRRKRIVGLAERSRSNPLRIRAGYKRRDALQSDLTRYYESCIVQKSSDGSAVTQHDKASCARVAWKRVKDSGRYSDYPGFNGDGENMARRMSSKRNRSRDRFGRFMDAAESKRSAKKRKAANAGAKKARKAAKRATTKAKRSVKATRKAARKATAPKKTAKKSGKKKSGKKKGGFRTPPQITGPKGHAKSEGKVVVPRKKTKKKKAKARTQQRREDTTMAKKSGSKKSKSAKKAAAKRKKAAKAAAAAKAAMSAKRSRAAKKAARSRKASAAKAPKKAKKAKKSSAKKHPKKSGSKKAKKAAAKKKAKKTVSARIPAMRSVRKSGGGSRSVPANISIRIGAPQPARKAAKRKGKKKPGRKSAHEGFALNPISTEYSMENPMTGGELALAVASGAAGYVLTNMFDRYLATRDRDPKDMKPGEPVLSKAEAISAPPGILRVLAQAGVAAASFVAAFLLPQPMARAAAQGFGLGSLTHLAGQVVTTHIIARFLKKSETGRRLYPVEIAVFERLHPATPATQQGLPYGVGGFLGGRGYGQGYPDTILRPAAMAAMDPAYAPPLVRNPPVPVPPPAGGGGGDCGPCQPCANPVEQGTLSAVERIASQSPQPTNQASVDSIMRATAQEICNPAAVGVAGPPNGHWHNAMNLGRDD